MSFVLQHYLAFGLPLTAAGLVILGLGWVVSKAMSI